MPTVRLQIGRPALIVGNLVRLLMLAPVKFDRQFCFAAGEIDEICSDWQLARETRPIARHCAPEDAFRLRCPVSQGTGTVNRLFWSTAHGVNLERLAALAYPPLTPPFQGGE